MQKITDNIYILVVIGMAAFFTLVITFVLFFIRSQKRRFKQKQVLHDIQMNHQKELLYTVIQSQEEERKRIGQNLHDDIGGGLVNLRAIANTEVKRMIGPLIENVHSVSHSLFPPGIELFGLGETVGEVCDRINQGGAIEVSFLNSTSEGSERLAPPVALALFRVIQELLANSVKHSGAKKIILTLNTIQETLEVSYRDDGNGFDFLNPQKGMGLYNIETRLDMIGATSVVTTRPGEGFEMTITYTAVNTFTGSQNTNS